jgi:hypothetical protein
MTTTEPLRRLQAIADQSSAVRLLLDELIEEIDDEGILD